MDENGCQSRPDVHAPRAPRSLDAFGGSACRRLTLVRPAPRNILIVLLIAVAVWLVPGGGTAAGIVGALIGIGFAIAIWFVLVYVYRNFRVTIFMLGDRHRGLLYGALAAILFLGASADRFFDDSALTLLWFAIVAAALFAFVTVFRHWREETTY